MTKVRNKKKPITLQVKYIGDKDRVWYPLWKDGWFKWSSYRNMKSAEEALKNLSKKWTEDFEFKIERTE